MSALTLSVARAIVDGVLSRGEAAGMKPLSCIVLDAGGHPVAFARADGASARRFDIARGKAHGAVALGLGSRALMARAETQPYFVSAVGAAIGGALVPVPGGVLIRDGSGAVIGAVGVTGDSSDNDEAAAVAAIEAEGLVADPG